ncbi:MAG: Ig-like domain-containing protein, partial [Candidatus Eisenbacteria bacterium]|nr:Ig-like domain-containing protein [Candidatus Eisenbacteria bacterium]
SWSMLLVGTSPRHGTSNVPINAPVRILFSDPLPGTVNPAFLSVVGSVSGTRSGSLSLENNGTTLVFEPTIPWVAGETVTVHVDAAVHRQDGEALDANADGSGGVSGVDDYEFQFVVAP